MATALPVFPSFDPNPDLGASSVRFKKYISRFRNLITAMGITAAARQKALLLHYVGEEVNDIFETLTVPDPGETDSVLEVAVKILTDYFMPKQNPVFEEYKFRNAKETHGELLMTFYIHLKQLSLKCEFTDVDRAIKTQIIQHGISHRLRRKALADPYITLDKLLEMGKTMELADAQASNLENKPKSPSKLRANRVTYAQSTAEKRNNIHC